MSYNLFDDDEDGDEGSLFGHMPSNKQVNSLEDEEKLPELPFSNEEPKKEETKLPVVENEPQKEPQQEIKEKEAEIINSEPIIEEKPKTPQKIIKGTGKKVHTKQDVENSLNKFKDDLQQKFDEIHLQISSLKPARPRYKHLALSNSKIVEKVRSIVMDSAEKDREIKNLENQISKFSDAFNEREERERLRNEIDELNRSLENWKKRNVDNANLNSFVSSLDAQLKKVEVDHKKAEELEKSVSNSKYESDKKKYENEKEELNKRLAKAESEKKEEEEKLKSIAAENERLSNTELPDYDKELKEFKQKSNDAVRKVVSIMSKGTLDVIQHSVKMDGEYSGKMCINALKQALMDQADEILGDDDDYDDYEYDE